MDEDEDGRTHPEDEAQFYTTRHHRCNTYDTLIAEIRQHNYNFDTPQRNGMNSIWRVPSSTLKLRPATSSPSRSISGAHMTFTADFCMGRCFFYDDTPDMVMNLRQCGQDGRKEWEMADHAIVLFVCFTRIVLAPYTRRRIISSNGFFGKLDCTAHFGDGSRQRREMNGRKRPRTCCLVLSHVWFAVNVIWLSSMADLAKSWVCWAGNSLPCTSF